MGALNELAVASLELEKVRDKVPILFERDVTFFSTVEKKNVEQISKRDMRVPLALRPGGYFGHWNPDGGALGRGGAPVYDKAVVNTVNLRYAMEWTALADWATNGGRRAVMSGVKKMLADAMKEFRRNVDALCMTNGQGQVGIVSAVANSGGFDTVTLATDGFGARLLRNGQKVTYYQAGLAAVRHASGVNTEITFYDGPNKQIKTATTTGLQAGDIVIVEGLSGDLSTTISTAPGTPFSITGVAYHHSDSSSGYWQGLSRATNPEVRANRVNANGALALPYARLCLNKVGDRVGQDAMGTKFTAWMHPCQVQAYEELGQLVSIIQKQAKDESLDLYFNDSMQMAGAPVKKHYSWDKKRIDFVNADSWGRAELKAADLYDIGGKTIHELRDTTTGTVTSTFNSYVVASFQMYHENPALAAYIDGLTVPTGY